MHGNGEMNCNRPMNRLGLLLVCLTLLTGCMHGGMMPTPNLYLDPDHNPFANVRAELQAPHATVIYATDRLRTDAGTDGVTTGTKISYGPGRCDRLALGACDVQFGRRLDWPELVKMSSDTHRQLGVSMRVSNIYEYARYPATPFALNAMRDEAYRRNDFQDENERAKRFLHEMIRGYPAPTDQKEIVLFIHGFNNTFEEAVLVGAQLWHFLGRNKVPVVYTWPAGNRGLTAYTTDSESGEYTVHHLKQFLLDLAECPAVGKVHIISHSRGTDVLTTALRELKIALDCHEGNNNRNRLKLGQVVLAAPDIDKQVFLQRFVAEDIFEIADNFTFYISAHDRALAVSSWLHGGAERLGLSRKVKTTPETNRLLGQFKNIFFVIADVKTDWISHDFFYNNAAVSSDLILLLGEERLPGEAYGRPMRPVSQSTWKIEQSYPWKRFDPLKGIFEFGLAPLDIVGRMTR